MREARREVLHHLRKISNEMHTVVTNPISNSITGSFAGRPLARTGRLADGLVKRERGARGAACDPVAPLRPPCVRRT
ncbi:hypothetical protein Y045_5974 [Burkholderia pseudomallei MSHR2451]|nr:hypothetical protein X992_5913 [Burkholderia pseudomallei MSHR5492]KGW37032.1 hypothetical protein Y045_5974 [Burkholderia pseudomallei MSHR2451]